MAKKNNKLYSLNETSWNVLNITLVKMLKTLTEIKDLLAV